MGGGAMGGGGDGPAQRAAASGAVDGVVSVGGVDHKGKALFGVPGAYRPTCSRSLSVGRPPARAAGAAPARGRGTERSSGSRCPRAARPAARGKAARGPWARAQL